MSNYLIVGAGSIGSSVADILANQGHHVKLVSRSGKGPRRDGVELVACDAADELRLSELAQGCEAIFNCANPPYHRWTTDWPPLAQSMLGTAKRTGAVLVTMSNLYPYGVASGPMSPETPFLATYEKALVRAKMWHDALDAHTRGEARVSEVRASDFLGASDQSMLGDRVIPRVLKGKSCQTIGDPDMTHSWTYVEDAAATLVACAQNPIAWGRAWHVPTNPPRTFREAVADIAQVADVPMVKVSRIPTFVIRTLGLFSPLLRELPKTMYQFMTPFIIDDSATRSELGLEPTPWREALRSTIEHYR